LIGEKKLRISEPLAGLDGEREKRRDQLIELEIAERVLVRFGRTAVTTEERRRACSVKTAPWPVRSAVIEAAGEPLGCVVCHLDGHCSC
jgi:hypothetical protein